MLGRLVCLVGISSLVIFACGDDGGGGSSITPEQACSNVAAAYCAKLDECAPFLIKAFVGGDQATCAARFKITCASTFTVNGTSATPERAVQCASDVQGANCEDVLARKVPNSCKTLPGTLADGTVCGSNAQCKGRLCRVPKDASCGACSSLGVAGDACSKDDECDYELSCVASKCVAKGRPGATCKNNDECVGTLGCNDGTCATPLAPGAVCTFREAQNSCDYAKGTWCHPKDKVCATIEVASPGQPCEVTADKAVACTGASRCTVGLGKGTCQALAADGATCNDTSGPYCQGPAQCAKGVCTISDPSSCK